MLRTATVFMAKLIFETVEAGRIFDQNAPLQGRIAGEAGQKVEQIVRLERHARAIGGASVGRSRFRVSQIFLARARKPA